MTFGEKLKDARRSAGYSQEELAEKLVDAAVWLLTPLMDVVKLSKQMNNQDNEYYLVNEDDRQYLVVVTAEYIESRALTKRITEKKFEIGNYKFINCGPIIEK